MSNHTTRSPDFLQDWQYLVTFFNFRTLRFLVYWFALVPFFLTILRDVPNEITVLSGNQEIRLHIELPFKWWILWFSSLSYILAWSIYLKWCPSFIKRHQNYMQYKQFSHSPRWIIWELFYATKDNKNKESIFKKLVEKNLVTCHNGKHMEPEGEYNSPKKGESETFFDFTFKGKIYRVALGPNSADYINKEREIFWEIFGFLAGSFQLARYSTWTFLIISMTLFAIVVLQNIVSVAEFLIYHSA